MSRGLRDQGALTGAIEAKHFLRARTALGDAAADVVQPAAYDWLENVVKKGRQELAERQIPVGAIEGWENACRVMFLLRTVRARNVGML